MDAFAVSICKGLSFKKNSFNKALIVGLYFGFFQLFMTLIGYLLGSSFSYLIEKIDHWIAFIALGIIGLNMIKESFEEQKYDNDLSFKTMIILSIATSIDALIVGITFAFLKTDILLSISIIGLVTFILCFIGVYIGRIIGYKIGNKANILGGTILIIIGIKVLIEHLFF